MPVPSPRNKILPARGNFADLSANVVSLLDGEICYAIDQDQYYQNEGGTLVSVGATKAQGALADTALQPGDEVVQSVAGRTGDVVLTSTDVGLENVDNTSDADKPISTATQSALDLKADLVGGVIPTSQIPAVAITEFLGSVDNETEMLALVGQPGDWCLRTDVAVGYVIVGADPSVIAGWEAFTVPGSAVTSINGQVGTVVLGPADVGALPTTATSDDISEGSTNLYSQWNNVAGGINYAGGSVSISFQGSATKPLKLYSSSSGGDAIEIVGRTTNGKNQFQFYAADGTTKQAQITSSDDSLIIKNQLNTFSSFWTNNIERLRITSDGNVGIGTDNPAFSNGSGLEVQQDGVSTLRLEDSSGDGAVLEVFADDGTRSAIYDSRGNPSNHGHEFRINGSPKVNIDSFGKVGIGTTSPSDLLTVVGPSSTNNTLALFTASNSNNTIAVTRTTSSSSYAALRAQANIAYLDVGPSFGINTTASDGTSPVSRLRINSDGNIGIGTDNPGFPLHLNGLSDQIRISDGGNGFSIRAGGSFIVKDDGTERLRIGSTGNVGIGTSSPQNPLHVSSSTTATRIQITNSTTGESTSNGTVLLQTGNTFAINNREASDIYFAANNVERLRIDSSGNVGIGTDSPSANLVIEGKGDTREIIDARTNAANGSKASLQLWSKSASGVNNYGEIIYDGDDTMSIGSYGSGAGTVDLAFLTKGNERARIDASGRLLVGTTTNDQYTGTTSSIQLTSKDSTYDPRIQIKGNATTDSASIDLGGGAQRHAVISGYTGGLSFFTNETSGTGTVTERVRIDSSGRFLVGTNSSTVACSAIIQGNSGGALNNGILVLARGATPTSTQQLGSVNFSDSSHVTAGRITCDRDGGTWTSGSSQPTALTFKTTANGSANPTERMRIDSSGNVGIGTTDPDAKLEVNGTIKATDINFTGLATYADDAAAGTGGLVAGDVYKTATGELRIKL